MRTDDPETLPFPRFGPRRGRPDLSVVVPVFEEEAILPVLVERLSRVLDSLGGSAEVILVDDGSRDGTAAAIARAHRADPRFTGLSLSRNFGHQVAISAGLAESSGAAVVVMDGDLQDPPEAIPALMAKLREGFDVVHAVRASRPEAWPKRLAYAAFYRVLGRAATLPIPVDSGDFGIMSRRVVDLIVAMPERRRYVRGLRAWVGFRQVGLPVDRAVRHSGRPKFTLAKLLGLAADGLVGFGDAPLRPAAGLGTLAIALAGVGGLGGLATGLAGWGWVGLAVLFFGGVQLISVAAVGEFLVRILDEVNGRPLYVVRERVGLEPPTGSAATRARPKIGGRR